LLEGFGYNEYVFRFFAFFCSILSVYLYLTRVTNHFDKLTQYIASVLFVFSDPLIFYSAQLKQYSSDVMIAVLLYALSFSMLSKKLNYFQMVLLGWAGFFSICFSHSAIIILSGVAISQMILAIRERNWPRYAGHCIVFVSWIASYLLIYYLYFYLMLESKTMQYQEAHFLSLNNLSASINKLLEVFKNPLDMTLYQLGFPVFVLGLFSLFKKNKDFALQLSLPLLIAIVASFFKKYPFHGRFLVFLLPALFIFLSAGFACIYKKGFLGRIFAIVLMGCFFIQPISKTLRHIVEPRSIVETRDLMKILKKEQIKGDFMYMNNEAQNVFWYYAQSQEYTYVPQIIGITSDKLRRDNRGEYVYLMHYEKNFDSKVYGADRLAPGKVNPSLHSLNELEGVGRTWILFSQIHPDAERHFIKCLDERGTKIWVEKVKGASLYLYDFM